MRKFGLICFLIIFYLNSYADFNQAIYIVDTGNNRIQKFSLNSEIISLWGQYGREPGMFNSPSAIAISSKGDYLYIVDTANNRIQKFSSDGYFILLWGGPDYGTMNGMFSNPQSIAVNYENGQDFVYVADTGNNRVQKFDGYGNWISNITGLNNPQGIASDYNFEYLYVADTGNNKIKKYDIRGNMILEWGGYGTQQGKFRYPRDIAVDKNNKVYVADGLNYRIQKFSSDGVFELCWGSKGSANGQFFDHFGLSVDEENNIYVADAGNNRIQKFTENGEWLGNIGDINQGTEAGKFYYPQGIEVYLERPIPYPTEIIPIPTREEITFTPTFTHTTVPTETFTNTPGDSLEEENPEDLKSTPTYIPTNTFFETLIPTLAETIETTGTPIITPTHTENQCVLYYSVEYLNKKCFYGKFNTHKIILKKFYKNFWKEKISIYENEEGGYIYEFETFNLKILVYDISGCYLDEIEAMIEMKNKFRKGHFYYWFMKKCMKKYNYVFNNYDDLIINCVEKNILKEAGFSEISKKENNIDALDETNVYNFPNPFKDKTKIRFSLDTQKDVKIIITDLAGKIVWQKNINSYETRPGVNYIEWQGINDMGINVSNGTYLYKIITDDKTVIKKIVKIK